MNAGFKAAEDLSVIEALEFQPPCEVRNPMRDWAPCEVGAEWYVTYRHHCVDGATKSRFICDPHMAVYSDPKHLTTCSECGGLGSVGDRIIRTERIGS